VAGGKDGVKRGFSILDFGFLIVPWLKVIEVLGAKKWRHGGAGLNPINQIVQYYLSLYNI